MPLYTSMQEKLTDQQKIKAIASIWSNENKLRIAQTILSKNLSFPAQMIEETGLDAGLVQKYLREMMKEGTVERTDYKDLKKNMVFYRLTALGRQVISFWEK